MFFSSTSKTNQEDKVRMKTSAGFVIEDVSNRGATDEIVSGEL